MLPEVATTRVINLNNTKEVAKQVLRSAIVTTKISFNVPLYKHDTKTSTEYWNLKRKQLNPQISWKIKGIYKFYIPTSKRCNLCLTKKLEILDDPDKNLLNKRSEIISQCRHKNKYRLKTLASNRTSGDVT